MIVPLSWLNEFVKIDRKNLKNLMWSLTEAGLTCEKFEEKEGDLVLDIETTPNRPDWMSVIGIAREISAITGDILKTKEPAIKLEIKADILPIQINPDFNIVPRITSVIIQNVNVKDSPDWLKQRIKQIGLRPINNLVDITNYVLWLHGSLLHVFDYDKILGHEMTVCKSHGGEMFRSLDGIDYILPKNSVIIKDKERIIDLLPLKGGENTSATHSTKTILLHSVLVDPVLTRRTSQSLKLQSDSSQRAERGLDPNGPPTALREALFLILELAGGQVASEIIDLKINEFKPATLSLNLKRLDKLLGIRIPPDLSLKILKKLNLTPLLKKNSISCTIPTYRQDLKIEEDLIEEVARIYGYNKFSRSLPDFPPPTILPKYNADFAFENKAKSLLIGCGFSEIYTYSLISNIQLANLNFNDKTAIKIENPVSSDFNCLRPTIIGNLLEAVKLNKSNFPTVNLFELGKIYSQNGNYSEKKVISAISNSRNFYSLKGVIELIFNRFGINEIAFGKLKESENSLYPFFSEGDSAFLLSAEKIIGAIGRINSQISDKFGLPSKTYAFEFDFEVINNLAKIKTFVPIPLFPPVIEDVTILIDKNTQVGNLIQKIKNTDRLINEVKLLDRFSDKITFKIYFQSPEKNLSKKETSEIIKKISAIFRG